jgi:hypothetical protein
MSVRVGVRHFRAHFSFFSDASTMSDTPTATQQDGTNTVVNADRLVSRIGTYIATNNVREIPTADLAELVQQCTEVASSSNVNRVAAVLPAPAATESSTGKELPKWFCQPVTINKAYERTMQRKMKKLRETLQEMTRGNLVMAMNICQQMPGNLKRSIRSDRQLVEALAQTCPDNGEKDTSAMDSAIVDNVKEFLALPAHQSGGSRKDRVQHMLDSILCAVSSSKTSTNKVSSRQLAARLGLFSHHTCVKAFNDREEVMQSQAQGGGTHKFCEPKRKKKRKDAGIKRSAPPLQSEETSVVAEESTRELGEEAVAVLHRMEAERQATEGGQDNSNYFT